MIDIAIDRYVNRQTDGQIYQQTKGHIYQQTDIRADIPSYGQKGKHSNRQKDRYTNRQTEG
jgi:hypothetical protein